MMQEEAPKIIILVIYYLVGHYLGEKGSEKLIPHYFSSGGVQKRIKVSLILSFELLCNWIYPMDFLLNSK